MKETYTKKEVLIMLEKQREHSAFILLLNNIDIPLDRMREINKLILLNKRYE